MRLGLAHCLALLVLLMAVADAEAVRRTLRIDFGEDWGLATDCSASGVEQPFARDPEVRWMGFRFSALSCAVIMDAYCQETTPGFFNELSFPDDEMGLAQLVGPNTDDAVFGVRQSILRIGRFDAQVLGYGGHQWAFYFFPNDIVIVALYGLLNAELDDLPAGFVTISGNGTSYENSNFQGEYFCFRAGEFTGTWDGEPVGNDPSSACPNPFVFRDGFE